jgi:hypothetical protein
MKQLKDFIKNNMSFAIPAEIEPMEIELPMGIDKWKQHGDKYGYTQYFKDELIKAFRKEFEPEIKDHMTCGNDQCFHDGWCYHLTSEEFEKMIKFLEDN